MPDTTVRERKRLEREARVLEQAMRLAAGGGYDAVQMREVAARSDVAMGTIYRYFSGKDAVLVAGLAEWVSLARRRMVVPAGPPATRVTTVLTSMVGASLRQPTLMAALIGALSSTDPQVAEEKARVGTELIGLLTDAVETGGAPPGVDVDAVCRVIAHVWFSAIVGWVGGVQPADSVMAELSSAVALLLD